MVHGAKVYFIVTDLLHWRIAIRQARKDSKARKKRLKGNKRLKGRQEKTSSKAGKNRLQGRQEKTPRQARKVL